MRIIDPGHCYALYCLDDIDPLHRGEEILQFVKREGAKYPGNVGHCPGTNMQEVLRALIDRAKYVNNQIPHNDTFRAIDHLTKTLFYLEARAADRHGRSVTHSSETLLHGQFCLKCGHIGCGGQCHA